MAASIRAFIRLLLFPTITFFCAVATLVLRALRFRHRTVYRVFAFWRRAMRWVLNVKVVQEGRIPGDACIIMANHRSYLDVVMIPSRTPLVFVAKASVRKWPIIGWGGDGMKTIWVDRSDADSRKRTRKRIMARIRQGLSVVIFPEGTTTVGPELLPFKPGMFHAVAGGMTPIVPVAIEYENPNIAWVGDDTFIGHFLREFGARRTEVRVCFGEPMTDDDGERLCTNVHQWISGTVMRYRQSFDALDALEATTAPHGIHKNFA